VEAQQIFLQRLQADIPAIQQHFHHPSLIWKSHDIKPSLPIPIIKEER
jgi:hypothetical protein